MNQDKVTLEEREQRIEDAERNNYLVRGGELAAIRAQMAGGTLFDHATTLEEREQRIENATRNSSLVRGLDLAAIRDGELWREKYNYATFEEYCEERWELAKARTYQLINAAAFAVKVHHGGLSVPSRERHIRPLLERLALDEDRLTVWGDVLAKFSGLKFKAADVDNAITRFLAWRNKEYITLEEWREIDAAGRAAMLGRVAKAKLNKQ